MLPSYLSLSSADFIERISLLNKRLSACDLCAHSCGVDRRHSTGRCGCGVDVFVASCGPHYGEEPFLSGTKGAGTIFFSGCNAACVYCQNYQISQQHMGDLTSIERLSGMMLELQEKGCHNIDLVTPTHYVPQIVEALFAAILNGLRIPLVYNTNAYDSLPTLQLLDSIVDIYLPDIKYSDDSLAAKYSGLPGYWEAATKAVAEMYRQVGNLQTENEIAVRGVVVRHLVLPEAISGSNKVLDFLRAMSEDIQVGLMSQYNPLHNAWSNKPLARKISPAEYQAVIDYAVELGLDNIMAQDMDSPEEYVPDFKKENPFL